MMGRLHRGCNSRTTCLGRSESSRKSEPLGSPCQAPSFWFPPGRRIRGKASHLHLGLDPGPHDVGLTGELSAQAFIGLLLALLILKGAVPLGYQLLDLLDPKEEKHHEGNDPELAPAQGGRPQVAVQGGRALSSAPPTERAHGTVREAQAHPPFPTWS